jgi:peptide/nickel transport system ATP-binding protein
MGDCVLKVRNLTTRLELKGRAVTVVDGVSFDLRKGKTLAIVGESGCGKSMTALSLLRILPEPPALPPEGEVVYRGQNLLKLSEAEMRKVRGDRIAMIFQDPMTALNPVYPIGDQLVEVAELHLGIYGVEAQERAISALEDVNIADAHLRMRDYPHQLSGGMKQRVMIAMALMCEPDVLIADEPTTALDVTIQAQVLSLMRELQARKGMAILLITHDMGVVAEMADEVIVMYATRIVEKGDVHEIFDRMAHPYTQGLFRSLPSAEKGQLDTIQGMVPPIDALPDGCPFHPRCKQAMAKCQTGRVPNFWIKDPVHRTHCWLYEKEGTDVKS